MVVGDLKRCPRCSAIYMTEHYTVVYTDIDECTTASHYCDLKNTVCLNTLGSYVCGGKCILIPKTIGNRKEDRA